MERAELFDLWTQHNDRPAFVREHREEIHEHTSLNEPIPDGSLAKVSRWLDRYKGTVTRQLNDDAEGSDPHDEEEGNE